MTVLAERIARIVDIAADRDAIFFRDQAIRWSQLGVAIAAIAEALEGNGVEPDHSVGLLGRNWLSTCAAFIGIIASDHALLLINPIRNAGLIAEELVALDLAAVLAATADWTQELREAAAAAGSLALSVDVVDGAFRIARVLERDPARAHRRRVEGTQIEIQTSGTTGKPKRISISERAVNAALRDGVRSATGAGDADVIRPQTSPTLMFGPLVHTSGTFNVLMSVFEARPVVLFEKFDPEAFVEQVRRHRPKFAPLPPTALKMVLESSATREDMQSLLAVRSGTAALPVETQIAFEQKFGVPVLTNYGATEFMGTVTGWSLDEYKRRGAEKRGSVGRASKGVVLRVVDPVTREPVAAGGTGILEAKIDRLDGGESWIGTSDLARLDGEGFLFIVGRADDAIIRGGFKVMGGKVADVLRQHPAVKDVIVLGVADDRLGQVPVAVLEGAFENSNVATIELIALAKARLNPYEVPVRIVLIDRLPRTVSDKISRPEALKLIET